MQVTIGPRLHDQFDTREARKVYRAPWRNRLMHDTFIYTEVDSVYCMYLCSVTSASMLQVLCSVFPYQASHASGSYWN
jgi:hypothetical protein